jgi:hypothetical protein
MPQKKSTTAIQQQGTSRGTKTHTFGLPAEALGAAIGAVIGSAATALLKTPKGQHVNVTDGLTAGARTAGALAVGQMGLIAGDAVSHAAGMIKDAQDKANQWLAETESRDRDADRATMAAEEEESQQSTAHVNAR